MTHQSPTATLIPLFSSSEHTGCGYPGLLDWKIVLTCAAGGSRTLDFPRERRTHYPLSQALRSGYKKVSPAFIYNGNNRLRVDRVKGDFNENADGWRLSTNIQRLTYEHSVTKISCFWLLVLLDLIKFTKIKGKTDKSFNITLVKKLFRLLYDLRRTLLNTESEFHHKTKKKNSTGLRMKMLTNDEFLFYSILFYSIP